MMLTRGKTYDAGYNAFRWNIPEFYKMASQCQEVPTAMVGSIAIRAPAH